MKIQLVSDLHLEFLSSRFPGETLIQPATGADVLVLAGDIQNGTQAIELFRDWPVPVLYVAGNHEFYGQSWEQLRVDLREQCKGSNIHFMDNTRIDISGVRLLGCTLWTDFSQSSIGPDKAMRHVEQRLNDFKRIKTQTHGLTPLETVLDHQQSVQWLKSELRRPYAGRTVVISHHAPHPLSIHPRYLGDPLNAAFASDLTELVAQADLWLHGHVHDSFDYRVEDCRVVANPAGYIVNRYVLRKIGDAIFENGHFKPECVIEIASSVGLL